MGKTAKKLFAILSVMFMMVTSLAVIDPNMDYSVAETTIVTSVTSEDYSDDIWADVTSETELKNALSDKKQMIRLKNSITLSDTLVIDNNVLLNLNKKTLSNNFSTTKESAVVINANVTLEYGTVSVSGCTAIEVSGNGYLTLVTVDVAQTGNGASAISVEGNGTLTVDAAYSSGISGNAHAILLESGEVTLNGGTYASSTGNTIQQSNTTEKVVLTINGGNINNGGTNYGLCTEGGSDATITINSGIFNSKVDASVSTVTIWGGQFEKDIIQGIKGHDAYLIHGGMFKEDISTSGKIAATSDVTTVTIYVGSFPYSEESRNYVYQLNSIQVESSGKYYKTITDAFNDSEVTNQDTIKILKAGTYLFNMPSISKSTKIKGTVDGVILDAYNTPQYASGQNMYLENLTIKRANESYLGFCESETETYVNVTFTTLFYVYAASGATFKNCTFKQPDINNYSVDVYGTLKTTFDNCSFVSGGKSVLVYNEGEFEGREVIFNNCTFVDKCFAKDKAAVEVHTEYIGESYIADRSGWDLYFNNCVVTGFYDDTVCENNLWNTVNNDYGDIPQTKSTKSKVYIDSYMEYPTPAKYTVTLKDEGTVKETKTNVLFGKTMGDATVPVKEGYIFNGYYNSTFTSQYFDSEGKCVRSWDVRSNGELYASWTKDTTHNITFDANGATGTAPTTMTVQEGESYLMPEGTLAITDYGFVGWSDGFKTYSGGNTYIMGASDISLTAVWAKNYVPTPVKESKTVTLTVLDKNGLSVSAAEISIDGENKGVTDLDGSISVSTTYDIHSVNIVAQPSLNQTKTVTFKSESETIQLVDYEIKTVVDSSELDTTVAVDNIDVVAKSLKKDSKNVTLTVKVSNSADAISSAEEKIDATKNLSQKSDCIFLDISVYLNNGAGDKRIYSINEILEIIIPFNTTGMNDGYVVYHCHTDEVTKKVSYTLMTNAKTEESNTYYVEDGKLHLFLKEFSECTVNYTAKGSANVTYQVNGGSVSAPLQSSVPMNKSFIAQGYSGVKEGFTFGGWSYNGETYNEGDSIEATTEQVTLEAIWIPNGEPEKKTDSNLTLLITTVLASVFLSLAAMFIVVIGRR